MLVVDGIVCVALSKETWWHHWCAQRYDKASSYRWKEFLVILTEGYAAGCDTTSMDLLPTYSFEISFSALIRVLTPAHHCFM